MTIQQRFKSNIIKEFGLVIIFIVYVLILAMINPAFVRPMNLINVVKQASVNGILAMGMMFVIITGGIDLSMGSVVALSGVCAAFFAHPGDFPIIVPFMVAIIVGVLAGFGNGVGVAYGNIPPFIITLGTMSIARGLGLVIAGGSPVFNMSEQFEKLASGTFHGIPYLPFYFIIIVAICAFILNKTVLGRRIYAVGGNELAARVSGVNVKYVKLGVYTIAGALSGIAGILTASRVISGNPTIGEGYEMDAVTAVIIGGVSLTGGFGKWHGVVIGALLISVIANSLDIMGVSSHYQKMIKGMIIIIAVLIDVNSKRRD